MGTNWCKKCMYVSVVQMVVFKKGIKTQKKKNDAITNNNDVTHAEDGVGMRVLLTLYVFIKSSERSRLYVGMVTIRFGDVFLLDAIKELSLNILFSFAEK